jgi:hypothetical protein
MLPGKIKIAFCIALFMPFINLSAQVAAVNFTVHVPAVNNDKNVYIAGSFNYWHAGDSLYKMSKTGEGVYTITLPLFEGRQYEYKYTLGKWDNVEIASNDSNIQNRRFISVNGKSMEDNVAKWARPKPAEKQNMSPMMKKMNAMKDSTLAKLQPELNNMLVLLKAHIQNLLQEKPDKRESKRIRKEADQKLSYIHDEMRKLLHDVLALITPEQKKAILQAISQPGADNNDFINTFMKAVGNAMNEKKPTP